MRSIWCVIIYTKKVTGGVTFTRYFTYNVVYINVIRNNMSVDGQPTDTSSKAVEEVKYEVTLTLNERFWNDDIKKYLFPGLTREAVVMVTDTPEVTLEVTDLWRATDLFYNNSIDQIRIKKLKV